MTNKTCSFCGGEFASHDDLVAHTAIEHGTQFVPRLVSVQEEGEGESRKVIETPSITTAELIAEEVWDGKGPPLYAIRRFNSGEVTLNGTLDLGEVDSKGHDVIYAPVDNGHLRKGMVLVPREPVQSTFDEAYRDACDLAFEIYDCEESKRSEFRLLVAISIGSWFLDRFDPVGLSVAGMGRFAPIVAIRGRSGSGKNRALNALRLVSYRPFFDLATVRVPSLYRPLDLLKGTLCLDECDVGGDERSDFTHFINSRCYGTPISRQNPESPKVSDVFASFGLSIITQRRAWGDDATENRTLPYYAEKSAKSLPTSELDEWVERGLELQNKLLWLRLCHWQDVHINKAARMKGVQDHRLTASILPVLALQSLAPRMVENLTEILLELERKRKQVRAASTDGVVVNALWDSLSDGLQGRYNGMYYVGRERSVEKVDGEAISVTVPLQTRDLAERLNWASASALRRVIHGLQISNGVAPERVRIGRRLYRPIWFDHVKLEQLLCDFVVDYTPGELAGGVPNVPIVPKESGLGESNTDTHGKLGTDGTQGTLARGDPV